MTKPQALIYVHGFLSSGAARKAQLTAEHVQRFCPQIKFFAPTLADNPHTAWEQLEQIASELKAQGVQLGFIGGSMGGFFSMYIAPLFVAKACLVNPCVDPYSLMPSTPTKMVNPYTKTEFIVDETYKSELRNIEKRYQIVPSDLAVYLETGDEVLDWHVAYNKFAQYKMPIMRVVPNGHHTFDSYAQCLPEMIAFLFAESNV